MSQSHRVDYEIIGGEMQMVVIGLDPGETVIAEAGAMTYLDDGVEFATKLGDGSDPDRGLFGKLITAGMRKLTGESVFMTHFTRQASGKGQVAFAAPFPGRIIAMDLAELGGEVICQKDSFVCAALGTEVSVAFNKRLGSGFFGGEGFILQKLAGDGLVFVHAGGTVMEKVLDDQTIFVDTGCLVAFTPGIEYEIEAAGGLKSMLFGGEGIFLTKMRGTGRVWLQSLPFSRLADRVLAMAPSAGGSEQGED